MKIPRTCPRGRSDCIALDNIIGKDETRQSFFCCGENNGASRAVEQDKYTVCFKGEFRDSMDHYDKRDLIHHASVMLRAVAVVERDIFTEDRDWSPWQETSKEGDDTALTASCDWYQDDDGWHSGCGRTWEFLCDGPEENDFDFCHGCGKPVSIMLLEDDD